jgi:folate-dependent phosphoribosylglycinamide formyltransferase PurN
VSEGVVLLVQPGDSSSIVYNALARSFDIAGVVMESEVSRRTLLSRRVRKLGLGTVLGQVAFRSMIVPPLARASRRRIREICEQHDLSREPIPEHLISHVESVNSDEACATLARLSPRVVVVNGTRIISKKTLAAVPASFVNTHSGITPLYRGVHGGYWALAENDLQHCGVTVHLVDPGIDTGGILGQATISPTVDDNFVTYPYLQYAAAVPLLRAAVSDLLRGVTATLPAPEGSSRLWSHPTLGQYLRNRLVAGTR